MGLNFELLKIWPFLLTHHYTIFVIQGERFSFSKQAENFGITKRQLQNHMSEKELQQYLEKALAVVILGSNDYVNNYLNPGYRTRSKFKPDKYADIVINQYTKQITVKSLRFPWLYTTSLFSLLLK